MVSIVYVCHFFIYDLANCKGVFLFESVKLAISVVTKTLVTRNFYLIMTTPTLHKYTKLHFTAFTRISPPLDYFERKGYKLFCEVILPGSNLRRSNREGQGYFQWVGFSGWG